MSRESNNIYLLPNQRLRATPVAPPRMPPLLADLRDRFSGQLRDRSKFCFDRADDALFELANNAKNADQQNLYLEAMRELRLKRSSLEELFHARLAERLNGWLVGGERHLSGQEKNYAEIDAEALTLLSDDEMEERVAIESMSIRARDRLLQPLDHLSLRLNHLLPGVVAQGHEANPFAPHTLSEAFVAAAQVLDAEMKAKLVLFKLFERHLLEHLDEIYQQLNQLLAEAGILPDLKGRSRSSMHPQRRALPEESMSEGREGASLANESEDLLASLHELLVRQRQSSRTYMQQVSHENNLSINELANILKVAQEGNGYSDRSFVGGTSTGIRPFIVTGGANGVWPLIQGLLDQAHGSGQQTIAPLDQDVIHLISMLFEFILNDYNIPEAMKAQLGRLQIPLLRAALLDRTFLNRGSHPARRLLNELASASVGLADAGSNRDQLYLKMTEVVERITAEFDTDVTLFQQLLDDFVLFMREERRRSELAEHRLRTAEDGRARMELARTAAQQVINELLCANRLPERVTSMLRDGWSHYLAILYLKEGETSEAWRQGVETARDLVWSVQLQRDAERARLLPLLPDLLRKLRDGLGQIAFDPCQTNEFFAELEMMHLRICQSRAAEPAAASGTAALAQPVQKPTPPVATVELMPEAVETVEMAAEEQIPYQDADLEIQLARLTIGSWVEFVTEQGKLRCKLVAFIKAADKYIFVNRAGVKVAQKQRSEMLAALAAGGLLILDDAQLFDRALTAVIGNLRDSVQELHS